MQTQFTLSDEDMQVLADGKPRDNGCSGLQHIGPILHRLFEQWESIQKRRARLETAMSGPYDADLSLCIDASLADEEAVADEITASLSLAEAHHE